MHDRYLPSAVVVNYTVFVALNSININHFKDGNIIKRLFPMIDALESFSNTDFCRVCV